MSTSFCYQFSFNKTAFSSWSILFEIVPEKKKKFPSFQKHLNLVHRNTVHHKDAKKNPVFFHHAQSNFLENKFKWHFDLKANVQIASEMYSSLLPLTAAYFGELQMWLKGDHVKNYYKVRNELCGIIIHVLGFNNSVHISHSNLSWHQWCFVYGLWVYPSTIQDYDLYSVWIEAWVIHE